MVFISSSRKAFLQNLSIILGLIIAVTVVTATELTIKWNNIQGVDTLASAGQTIPFAIGLASFVRIMYVYLFKDPNPHNGEPQSSNTSNESPTSPGLFPDPALPPPPPPRRGSSDERPMSRGRFPAGAPIRVAD